MWHEYQPCVTVFLVMNIFEETTLSTLSSFEFVTTKQCKSAKIFVLIIVYFYSLVLVGMPIMLVTHDNIVPFAISSLGRKIAISQIR